MPSKPSMVMTQAQWAAWAQRRRKEAPEIEKVYRRQAEAVAKVVHEQGCPCDPLIAMRAGEHGGPSTTTPMFTHAMDCPQREEN